MLFPAHWKAKATVKETGWGEEDLMLKVSPQESSCSSAPLHCDLGQVTFSTAHLLHYERGIVAPAQSTSWSPTRIKLARFAMELLYNANLNEWLGIYCMLAAYYIRTEILHDLVFICYVIWGHKSVLTNKSISLPIMKLADWCVPRLTHDQ